MNKISYIAFLTFITFFSCKKEGENFIADTSYYQLDIPVGFPYPAIPEDNKLSKARVELGKKLFFDPALSRNGTISCGTCHLVSHYFADTVPLSTGIDGRLGFRNTTSLVNVAYKPAFFMDGGVPTLELFGVAPIQEHSEMDNNILEVTERLLAQGNYDKLSQTAYNREIGPFVLTRALAAYQRTMISGNSDYDSYINGNLSVLTLSEKRGKDLFFSNKTNCSSCHSGFNFTNYSYQNIGLYTHYADTGRMRITLNETDRGKFMVPSLRNVAHTGPYMHDGSIGTLEEVVDFFNSGGQLNQNKSNLVKELFLTDTEKADLVNFLKSLTDREFLTRKWQ